jgi:hypothetical protein
VKKRIVQTFSRLFAIYWPVDGRAREFQFEKGVPLEAPIELCEYLMERSEEGREWRLVDELGEEVG